MSIGTYSELQSAIADWAAREDLTARIPDFIMLTEKAMGFRKLRVKEQLTPVVGYVSATDDTIAFPSGGFTEVHEAKVTGTWTGTSGSEVVTATDDYAPMERISDIALRSQYRASSGVPGYFCDMPDNSGWQFWPVGANYQVTVWVYGKVPALSDSAPTNQILTEYPHLYLYGALAEIERYLKTPPAQSQGWGQDFAGAIEAANRATKAAMFSGSTLRVRG